MNYQLRFIAWLLLIVVTTSTHSLAGEKTKRVTSRETTKRGAAGEKTRVVTYRKTVVRREVRDSGAIAADVLIARPAWFAETVVGGALFVVALPFAALSNTVDETARALVVRPGRATFRRQPGDFSTIE
jgi:hypothetical protein